MRRSDLGQKLVLACENCGGLPRGLADHDERPCRCPYDFDTTLGGAVARFKLILARDDRTSLRPPRATPGWELIDGPVKCVGVPDYGDGMVSVGDRVMAWWQRFGYALGNGTVVGFERNVSGGEHRTGWVHVIVDYDYEDSLVRAGPDGYVRWDFDRTERVDGRWDGETQEMSIARHRAWLWMGRTVA